MAGYLAFLPPSADQRALFSSLAHWLEVPLSELDRAVKARAPEAADPPQEAPAPVAEVDELLRPMLILCREPDFLARVAALPPAWWESLAGAPLLQCVLDANGDEDGLPPGVLAQVRRIEAKWSTWDEPEKMPDQVLMKLELGFVEREKQALGRQLQDPAVLVDPGLEARLRQSVDRLLRRGTQLRNQMKDLRRKSFSG
jgi:DNA primase